jgi:hypothetical protein
VRQTTFSFDDDSKSLNKMAGLSGCICPASELPPADSVQASCCCSHASPQTLRPRLRCAQCRKKLNNLVFNMHLLIRLAANLAPDNPPVDTPVGPRSTIRTSSDAFSPIARPSAADIELYPRRDGRSVMENSIVGERRIYSASHIFARNVSNSETARTE